RGGAYSPPPDGADDEKGAPVIHPGTGFPGSQVSAVNGHYQEERTAHAAENGDFPSTSQAFPSFPSWGEGAPDGAQTAPDPNPPPSLPQPPQGGGGAPGRGPRPPVTAWHRPPTGWTSTNSRTDRHEPADDPHDRVRRRGHGRHPGGHGGAADGRRAVGGAAA